MRGWWRDWFPCDIFSHPVFSHQLLSNLQIEAQDDPLAIGEITDKATKRERQGLDESGRSDDLSLFGQSGLLVNINHFQIVTTLEVFFAKATEIFNGAQGTGGLTGDVKAQKILLDGGKGVFVGGAFLDSFHRNPFMVIPFCRTSRPTSTRWVSERSPIILRMGWGNFRTKVGMARIWS